MIRAYAIGSIVALVGLTGCGFLSVDTSCTARHTCPLDDAGDDAAVGSADVDAVDGGTDSGLVDDAMASEAMAEAGPGSMDGNVGQREASTLDANAEGGADALSDGSNADALAEASTGDGSSSAQPSVLANLGFSGLLFVDGTAVYGTVGGLATAISPSTGATLATGTVTIVGLLAQSASSLYALATPPNLPQGTTGQELVVIPKATLQGATRVPAGSSGNVYATVAGAATTSSNLCFLFAQSSSVGLYSAALDGSNVIGPLQDSFSIAGDATGIAFFSASSSNNLQLLSTGPNCTLSSQNQPTALQIPSNLSNFVGTLPSEISMATDSSFVYFRSPADGLLYRVGRNASGFISLTATALANDPLELALDGTDLYWTDPTAGTVSRISLNASGDHPTILAQGQTEAGGIAVDATSVYWTTQTSLVKLAKP